MLLHRAGKEISEAAVKKVLEAGGITVDDAKVRALCASLQSVNIDEAIKNAIFASAPAPAAGHAEEKKEKKEEKKEEKKDDGAAAAGLGALFG